MREPGADVAPEAGRLAREHGGHQTRGYRRSDFPILGSAACGGTRATDGRIPARLGGADRLQLAFEVAERGACAPVRVVIR
jgi:hypothetical protein